MIEWLDVSLYNLLSNKLLSNNWNKSNYDKEHDECCLRTWVAEYYILNAHFVVPGQVPGSDPGPGGGGRVCAGAGPRRGLALHGPAVLPAVRLHRRHQARPSTRHQGEIGW